MSLQTSMVKNLLKYNISSVKKLKTMQIF